MAQREIAAYLRQLWDRTVEAVMFLLGVLGTVASFVPAVQPTWVIRPIAAALMVVGFVRANYSVWKDLHRRVVSEEEQRKRYVTSILSLVEHNVAAASGSTKGWQAALLNDIGLDAANLVRFVPDPDCRRELAAFAGKIQSAKEIYQGLQVALPAKPMSPEQTGVIYPAQVAIEDLCREIRETGVKLAERLRSSLDDR